MNNLSELFHDNVCNVVFDTHGNTYEIKEHRNWEFINYNNTKIGISKLPQKMKIFNFDDVVFQYVFGELSFTFPCPAIAYYVYRKMTNSKITIQEYKNKI